MCFARPVYFKRVVAVAHARPVLGETRTPRPVFQGSFSLTIPCVCGDAVMSSRNRAPYVSTSPVRLLFPSHHPRPPTTPRSEAVPPALTVRPAGRRSGPDQTRPTQSKPDKRKITQLTSQQRPAQGCPGKKERPQPATGRPTVSLQRYAV